MGMELTEVVQFRASKGLRDKLIKAGEKEGLGLSAFCRRIATLYVDGDGETLRLAANYYHLINPGVEYVTGEGE
jgi:hypothetical protein